MSDIPELVDPLEHNGPQASPVYSDLIQRNYGHQIKRNYYSVMITIDEKQGLVLDDEVIVPAGESTLSSEWRLWSEVAAILKKIG